MQRDLQQCFHTKESRVKRHFPTAFSQNIKQFREKVKTLFRFSDPEAASRLVLARSNRSEMDDERYGYEESRREEARLYKEKALRDTRIRDTHEVEEFKRAPGVNARCRDT